MPEYSKRKKSGIDVWILMFTVNIVLGSQVFTFVAVYAPQSGLDSAVKQDFYDTLQCHIAKVRASEVLIPLGDWNGHVGAECGDYVDVHGGHGFGTWNSEVERLLSLPVSTTW